MSQREAIINEAREICAALQEAGSDFGLLGGIAVALRCPSAARPPLRRDYGDIDIAVATASKAMTEAVLTERGYLPNADLNAMHGYKRLWFNHPEQSWKVDVFLDRIEMCHALAVGDRFVEGSETLPLTDLLLLKTQIIETNEKDLTDAVALLLDHPLDRDAGLDAERFADVLASDWGWWRTSTMVLDRIVGYARGLPEIDAETVAARAADLRQAADEKPKGLRWRARAKVGDRASWYETPEET